MKSAAVLALVAAGALGGGAVAAHELTRPVRDDHVRVDVITPAAQTTTATVPVPTATKRAVVVKRVTVKATAVPSVKATTRKATVKRQEATVSDPQPVDPPVVDETRGPNAPRKGPGDGAPGTPAPTGVFGGEESPTATS